MRQYGADSFQIREEGLSYVALASGFQMGLACSCFWIQRISAFPQLDLLLPLIYTPPPLHPSQPTPQKHFWLIRVAKAHKNTDRQAETSRLPIPRNTF